MPPIFMQSVRKQRADAQLHSQDLRATNCYKLSDSCNTPWLSPAILSVLWAGD
jgi:hypothetical protein